MADIFVEDLETTHELRTTTGSSRGAVWMTRAKARRWRQTK